MNDVEFQPWPKIPRETGEGVTITEKLDGTNACIVIVDGELVGIQSRNRFISEGKQTDNAGFAKWVNENLEELLTLGDGHHYGEWIGQGIQQNKYGIDGKAFYLFNTHRWTDNPELPSCCNVVPVLYHGQVKDNLVHEVMEKLIETGSQIAVGDDYKMYVEGVVSYYHKTKRMAKETFEYKKGKWADEQRNNHVG